MNRESERWTMETGGNQKNGHIQILIAEEQRIYADSLRALLEKEPDFKVVGVAPDGAAAVQMSQEKKPDILLLNVVKASGNDGMGVLDELQRLNIPVRPLLLATSLSGPDLRRALLLGARGVVLKTSSTQALFDGIRGVMVGQYWIGAEIGASMLGALRDNTRSRNGNTSKGAFGLTSREMEIVTTVVAGYSNAEIAKKYGISEQTVKHHLSSIFDRVGVSNRLELALFAINHRLVDDDS
ncbi:MAG: response regulator transcription factor [Terracidiphilus sp.]